MQKPLRVLHVVVNMNRGGAETLIMNLYRHLDRSKVQFDFLTSKEGVFDEEIRALGGVVYRLPYITDVGHFGYAKLLDRFFQENYEYKIIHSHMDKMSGLILRSAKKANIPVRIAHSHNTRSEGGFLARLYKWHVGQLIKSNSTDLFACSKAAAEWLFGSSFDKVSIINNGVDLEKFSFDLGIRKATRDSLGVSETDIVVGHIGRFCEQKNHMLLIDIFKEFCSTNPNAYLVLVGDGPLSKVIHKKVKDQGLSNRVKFLGIRSDVENLLQAFDLFVFPSVHEGLPVTLIEAQASGLPCLVSDTITGEVDMGLGLVDFLPLSKIDKWCLGMNRKIERLPHSSTTSRLKERGYDVKMAVSQLADYYIKSME